MGQKPDEDRALTPTLHLTEFRTGGAKGFWLWDETRGMNLSMRAKTEDAAFIEALTYYQKRLQEYERAYSVLRSQVDNFIKQTGEPDDSETA